MKSNERGIALVSALLSVALLTLIVLEATDAAMLHSHLARNAGDSSAARLLARAAEEGGSAYLGQMLRTREPTTRLSLLPLSLVVLPLGAGDVSIRVEDEEGKLNLNQIADRPHRRALEKLFESLELDVALLDSVAVWVDADAGPGEASLAAGTCALPFPCQPHGGPLRSLEELRLIQGFDEKTIDSLRPFGYLPLRVAKSMKITPCPCKGSERIFRSMISALPRTGRMEFPLNTASAASIFGFLPQAASVRRSRVWKRSPEDKETVSKGSIGRSEVDELGLCAESGTF